MLCQQSRWVEGCIAALGTCWKRYGKMKEETDDLIAMYNLGVDYRDGIGVKQNLKKAAQWYMKAAEQNDAKAQYMLGYLYKKGLGVEQDMDKAIEFLDKAIEQGHEYARDLRDSIVPF